jgi:periplasmic divalent cation tolerance protein
MKILLCTIDKANASILSHKLLQNKVAACANLLDIGKSVYEWEGEICEDPEVLMIIKTSDASADRCFDFIKKEHPYDVPEIVLLDPIRVLDSYADWVNQQTR